MGGAIIKILDYEHIPFKCNICHVYGHFSKICPKTQEEQPLSKKKSREEPEFKMVSRSAGILSVRGHLKSTTSQEGFPTSRNNQFEVLGNLEGSINPEDLEKESEKEAIEPKLWIIFTQKGTQR
jgi:hypothetical protein